MEDRKEGVQRFVGARQPDLANGGALFGEAWSWRQVDHATGDKPTTGRFGRKSNTDLTAALERELRKRGELARRQQLDPWPPLIESAGTWVAAPDRRGSAHAIAGPWPRAIRLDRRGKVLWHTLNHAMLFGL